MSVILEPSVKDPSSLRSVGMTLRVMSWVYCYIVP